MRLAKRDLPLSHSLRKMCRSASTENSRFPSNCNIALKITYQSRSYEGWGKSEADLLINKRASGPSGMVISGDPFGSRMLTLLLQNSGYQAKFLPISSLNEPGALEDGQLLVLTPTRALTTEDRMALLATLTEVPRDVGLIIIELITLSEERRAEEEAQEELPSHKVHWPCRIEELEQRIEAAVRTAAR